MIRVVIVDDEKPSTESLSIELRSMRKDILISGVFNKPVEALHFIKNNDFDLLFLDIEMPGMNGFDLLDKLDKTDFEVIFTTAYDQYAIKAFKFSAIHYLLKPIDYDDLTAAIDLWERRKQGIRREQIELFKELMSKSNINHQKIALPTTDGFELINIQDIIRCQAENNYTRFFLADGAQYLICRTLKDVESILVNNQFIRTHQSHLINPVFIRKYIRNDGGFLIMEDESKISISRARKESIINLINSMERLL
ncbi:MAG: response regulator transcription factor [Cyclobacteriaceae bacterium]|nr:response regulator transcription factor [Cyclobacteriaceae bacterium]